MIKKTDNGWIVEINKTIYPTEYITKAYEEFRDEFEIKLEEKNDSLVEIKIKPKKDINEETIYEFLNYVLATIKEEI